MLDFGDAAGLKVIRIRHPSSRLPVEASRALAVLKVRTASSSVRRVTVFAVLPTTVPVTWKEIWESLWDSGFSPVIPLIVISSSVVPLNSPVYETVT